MGRGGGVDAQALDTAACPAVLSPRALVRTGAGQSDAAGVDALAAVRLRTELRNRMVQEALWKEMVNDG